MRDRGPVERHSNTPFRRPSVVRRPFFAPYHPCQTVAFCAKPSCALEQAFTSAGPVPIPAPPSAKRTHFQSSIVNRQSAIVNRHCNHSHPPYPPQSPGFDPIPAPGHHGVDRSAAGDCDARSAFSFRGFVEPTHAPGVKWVGMGAAVQYEQATTCADDTDLVRRVQTGDVHAFGQLVTRYQDRVYNACWRICPNHEDARDLAQETFLKAYRAIGTFQQNSSFYTWIFRIAANLALSQRKKARLRLVTSLDTGAPQSDDQRTPAAPRTVRDEKTPSPHAHAEAGEMMELVAAAMDEIDPHHRAVLVLRDIEGFDYRAIADVLQVPVGTVKSRVSRARTALREALERRTTGDGPGPKEGNAKHQSRQIG